MSPSSIPLPCCRGPAFANHDLHASHLQEPRQHNVALILVAIAKLLAVCLLLAHSPSVHVVRADADVDHDRHALGNENGSQPRNHLPHVVRARHQPEAVARRKPPLRLTGLAQRLQVEMHARVSHLSEDVDGETDIVHHRDDRAGSETPRAVDLEGRKQTGWDPVVSRVPKDVGPWHGGGGEAVHEKSLKLALGEVAHDNEEGQLLRGIELVVFVRETNDKLDKVRHSQHHEGLDDQGSEILENEDSAPGNLQAHVLDEDLAGRDDGRNVRNELIAVLESRLGRRVVHANAVVVAVAGSLGDGDLDIVDGRAGADGKGGGETLDGPLGSYRFSISLQEAPKGRKHL